MTILPLTYLGNIRYYSTLLRKDCVIDLYENYVKQTFRNRCEILTAQGEAALTVNVVKGGSSRKRPLRDIRIDYSKRWQHQHWVSIVSAYKGSPYFDHYSELFAPFFSKEFGWLADLNAGLLETVLQALGSPVQPLFSDRYVEAAVGDEDMRAMFKSSYVPEAASAFLPYEQVFSDRLPFRPNLSIIDLLFCEGPCAKSFL